MYISPFQNKEFGISPYNSQLTFSKFINKSINQLRVKIMSGSFINKIGSLWRDFAKTTTGKKKNFLIINITNQVKITTSTKIYVCRYFFINENGLKCKT